MLIIVKGGLIVDNWQCLVENELKLKGYSKKTLKAYLFHIGKFIESGLEPKEYLLKLIGEGKSKESVRVAGFAVKFYLRVKSISDNSINQVIQDIPNQKRDKQLPVILSKNEINDMIIALPNFIHRVMIMLMYSAGMRAGEIIGLDWQDIDMGRNIIHIKLAKGGKDRIVMLSPKVKKELHKLGTVRTGNVFKTNRGESYSLRSIELIVKNAAKKAGINKKVTPHSLRHSFATHLLEQGVDIRYIKDLLGHASISTTMIYTHVSNRDISKIKSPLD